MRADPPLYLRLPADLQAWVRARAAENRRSLTGEVTVLLEKIRQQEPATVIEVAAPIRPPLAFKALRP